MISYSKNKPLCLWLTGLPCSGKTTIALELEKYLRDKGIAVEHLDGDVLRSNITAGLGFSKEDRDKNISIVSFLAKMLVKNGVTTIVSFVSPYIEARNRARQQIGNFVEIYVNCPLEECERRDVKGMYKKARSGVINYFTGIQDPYEVPQNPEITVNTAVESLEESIRHIILRLEELAIIERKS